MHAEASEWVARCVDEFGSFTSVVEIGGRNINGTIRDLFTGDYLAVDLVDGPGVDIVGDAIDLAAAGVLPTVDCVVTTEALEHHPNPAAVLNAARSILRPGGVLIATMAGPGRHPHSGLIEGPPQPGEHYQNITPDELAAWLAAWTRFEIDRLGLDLRCWAIR